MKGDVYMSRNATLKTNIEDLKKRAIQRNISFSSKAKTESDVKVENDFFKTMESQIYKQIVRN
jgi:hypothetical protein